MQHLFLSILPEGGIPDILGYSIIAFVILFIISLAIRPNVALKHWHHHFPGVHFSSKEVYEQVKNEVGNQKIPDVVLFHGSYLQAGIFSPRREFLTVYYKTFSFDICCASFGDGCYVSWWFGQEGPGFWSRVPILNNLLGINPKYQSYYQIDAGTMFQSAIHDSVMKVIDQVSNTHGTRLLTEFERQPQIGKKYP